MEVPEGCLWVSEGHVKAFGMDNWSGLLCWWRVTDANTKDDMPIAEMFEEMNPRGVCGHCLGILRGDDGCRGCGMKYNGADQWTMAVPEGALWVQDV